MLDAKFTHHAFDIQSAPRTRIEALRLGEARFFTGKPCSKGHLEWRNAANGNCRLCSILNTRKYAGREGHSEAARVRDYRLKLTSEQREAFAAQKRSRWHELVRSDPIGRWVVHATNAAKQRAKRKGVPFELTREFVRSICPTHCPALGVELVYCNPGKIAENSAQLDRKVPRLGYVSSNVRIISKRANVVKNDASADEIRRIYEWLLREG